MYISTAMAPLTHNPLIHMNLNDVADVKHGPGQPSPQCVISVQLQLKSSENWLQHGEHSASQKINIHCASVTLCEYLSHYEASRDQEPCNQYLLVVPSEN